MKHCANEDCIHRQRFGRIAEYRDEASRCADCGGGLAPGPAPGPVGKDYRELVTVYLAPDPIRGHLLRSILVDRGLEAFVLGEALSGAIGELPATVLQVRVQVPPEHASEASWIAAAFDRGDYDRSGHR